ncbi:MAG: PQQ-binding-like beta-propeller repeat protein, partial [Anaerolineae bacterium]|nr:PQQ-binding-like beta-propeller repeat protein [Anaerolineae bacterium]
MLDAGNLEILWSAKFDTFSALPPLVAGDLLLIPTRDSGRSTECAVLHALGLDDGGVRWEQAFDHARFSGLVAVAPDVILVSLTSADLLRGTGALLALDAAGEERWRWTAAVQRVSAPAVAGDTVYFTVDTHTLVILDLASGQERACVPLAANASFAAPALVDGVVYLPCRGPQLLVLTPQGELHWRFDLDAAGSTWLSKTPLVHDARLFTVSNRGEVLALARRDGALQWRVKIGPVGKPLTAPISDGERLYIGARDGLYALDLSDGRAAWHFPTARKIDPQARPVVHNGVVYATCHDRHLYALDAATGKELWPPYTVERRLELPPVLATCGAAGPCVIVADRGGALTAIARPPSAAKHPMLSPLSFADLEIRLFARQEMGYPV